MKKIAFILLSALPIVGFAQSGNYLLKGKLGNMNSPAKVYLTYRSAGVTVTDSSKVQNGIFEFKGAITNPFKVQLLLNRKGNGMRGNVNLDVLEVYLENGIIEVTSADSLSTANVSGLLNADNLKLHTLLKPAIDKQKALEAEYDATPEAKQKSKEFQDDFEKRYDAIEAEIKQLNISFVQQNPGTLVSLDAIKTSGGSIPDVKEIEPLFNSLSDEVKTTIQGKEYAKAIALLKSVAIGSIAPDFAQNTPDGKAIKLSDFRGKYLLLDFWASWCGPCRRDNPNVVKIFNQYKDKNFTILGVSLDREKGREAWLKAIEKDGLTWSQVSDLKFWNNAAAQLYGVKAIPQNFLIDPEGKIVAHNLHGDELAAKLAEIFTTK